MFREVVNNSLFVTWENKMVPEYRIGKQMEGRSRAIFVFYRNNFLE
jgi:hypothetical protein